MMKSSRIQPGTASSLGYLFYGVNNMVTLSDDEVALIRSILIALRAIKVRDIDKALVVLSQGDRRETE